VKDSLNVIVVGYGLAGQVHAKTYRHLANSCRLAGIVDCRLDTHTIIKKQFPEVGIFQSLEQALTAVRGNIVVDLCVPAPQNIALAKTTVAFGVQNIMLEKPLGWSLSMAVSLADILRGKSAIYLDTYRSSLGIEQLLNWISREQSEIDSIHIKFNKNRIPDSFSSRGFDDNSPPDAWHIEGPHMVTIAMKIAGEIVSIEDSRLQDMTHNNKSLANHGGAHARVKHASGVHTLLSTDLCSNENERLVEVFLKNRVRLRLLLPASKMTQLASRLEKIENGRVVDHFIAEDRPMEQCVRQGIDYFLAKNTQAQNINHGVLINGILQSLTDSAKKKLHGNFKENDEGVLYEQQ
jgi:predicted dehydrogenase